VKQTSLFSAQNVHYFPMVILSLKSRDYDKFRPLVRELILQSCQTPTNRIPLPIWGILWKSGDTDDFSMFVKHWPSLKLYSLSNNFMFKRWNSLLLFPKKTQQLRLAYRQCLKLIQYKKGSECLQKNKI
jgi:hypothetical protein